LAIIGNTPFLFIAQFEIHSGNNDPRQSIPPVKCPEVREYWRPDFSRDLPLVRRLPKNISREVVSVNCFFYGLFTKEPGENI
jgi:hypothetical protein